MDIEKELLREHSKAQASRIAQYVSEDQKRFDLLMKLFLKGEYRLTQRAAWVVSNAFELHPPLIKKYIKDLFDYLEKPGIHDAVKRNILRIFQYLEFSEAESGRVYDLAFAFFTNRSEPIAIRVFAMTVLGNICKKYPELKNELIPLIEEELNQEEVQPAYISRARKTLKQLAKL